MNRAEKLLVSFPSLLGCGREAAREQISLFGAHPGQLTESAEGGRRFSFHKTEFSVVIHGVEDH